MAIAYDTYYAIPVLKTYREALDHYHNVKPIQRDPHETRPLGKRTQKWVSIWVDDRTKAVHVGYGVGELSNRRTLVSYDPGGVITVPKRTRWSRASYNERLSRLLGAEFKTYQYDTWVRCEWFDGREARKGWLPCNMPTTTRWDATEDVPTNFVMSPSGKLTYLNYKYPETHTINRAGSKLVREPFNGFLHYARSMQKLQDTDRLSFSEELRGEMFGWREDYMAFGGRKVPKHPDSPFYGSDMHETRAEVLRLASSEDNDDRLKALVWLTLTQYGLTMQDALNKLLMREYRDLMFTSEVHKHGQLVRDRYKAFFRD